MRARNAKRWMTRVARAVAVAALVGLPTASSAVTWLGSAKEWAVCPGVGGSPYYDDFTLIMEPGSGWGQLTYVGYNPIDVWVDWHIDGNWSYFSASYFDPAGGPYILTGWIKGRRFRGWLVGHDYVNGCVMQGKVKGWQ